MQENERRKALADFLRQRREKLSPAEVGLPPGLRRRTPGLRREEVAQLANMGTSWYVWLEQGRAVHPSDQILESLAMALKLSPNERRHLFLLAGHALPPHISASNESISPALQRMLDDLNPTPAYIMGRRLDYLAWNNAANVIFSLEQATAPYARNMIWRVFTNAHLRNHPHWESMVRSALAEFRAANARYPDDQNFEELIAELKRVSPEFCLWWPHHNASSSSEGHKLMEHPTLGHLEFEQITLQLPNAPDVRVIIYTPLADTATKLQCLGRTGSLPESANMA